MIECEFFITPHAVERFQSRICPMPYERALGVIIRALEQDSGPARPTENGKGLMIRVRGQWNFRAVVIGSLYGKPAVVTILRSGK